MKSTRVEGNGRRESSESALITRDQGKEVMGDDIAGNWEEEGWMSWHCWKAGEEGRQIKIGEMIGTSTMPNLYGWLAPALVFVN